MTSMEIYRLFSRFQRIVLADFYSNSTYVDIPQNYFPEKEPSTQICKFFFNELAKSQSLDTAWLTFFQR